MRDNLRCTYCESKLNEMTEYIKVDEDTRYCENCVETSFTIEYFVCGEFVGTDDDIELIEVSDD